MTLRHIKLLSGVILFFYFPTSHAAFEGQLKDKPDYDVKVDQHDSNSYRTISDAIDSAPETSIKPFRIFIAAGDYYERLVIAKNNIQLIGAGQTKTRIHYDIHSGQEKPPALMDTHHPHELNSTQWSTWQSATLTIRAKDFTAKNLHIENSFDYPGQEIIPKNNPNRINGLQAVSVMTDYGSDRVFFQNVTISGFQDTIFVLSGRSVFHKSIIKGHIDFIFGAGRAAFIDSDIISRKRYAKVDTSGFITAPSTDNNNPFGLVFTNSRLLREAGVPDNSVSLGRPWHPTTTFSDGRYADPNAIGQTVFINCWMDSHIKNDPWDSMTGRSKDGSKVIFQPENTRFYEYQSYGPGAILNHKRPQLSELQIDDFVLKNILLKWEPLKNFILK